MMRFHRTTWKLKETAMKHLGSAVLMTIGNGAGDCWRTKERYAYPPNAGVQIYADDWKWGPNDKYRWREHEGRGYWGPEGVWIEF
jgi:hypothetical protein